jgi:hypothetical protein
MEINSPLPSRRPRASLAVSARSRRYLRASLQSSAYMHPRRIQPQAALARDGTARVAAVRVTFCLWAWRPTT